MKRIIMCMLLLSFTLIIAGCSSAKENNESPHVVETYDLTDSSLMKEYFKEGKMVTYVKYYEMSDGTWKTDEHSYRYKIELSGRMPNAVKDITYIILTNEEGNITFEQAMKSKISSNDKDFFDKEKTIIVANG